VGSRRAQRSPRQRLRCVLGMPSSLEVKASDGSPKHVSADYYYRIPVRPIHKQYPIYAPGHEPPGYFEWLKKQKPVIVWDDKGHAPPLETEAD
jgi:hypothetical protein